MKYRAFHFNETIEGGWWGLNWKYKDENDLRDYVAKFLDEIGDKFFFMTADEVWESRGGNRHGEVVVWYKS